MPARASSGLDLAEQDRADLVVGGLAEHERGARARREDVLDQVGLVHRAPHGRGEGPGLGLVHVGEPVEERALLREGALLQREEPVDEPALDVAACGRRRRR